MTKYVISGYIGFDNFGDEAIAKALTSYLKSKGAKKITVLSSNPNKTTQLYDVNSVNYLEFFKPILESDILISGGGSLLQDVTSLKSLIYYLAVIVTALVFNKKVIIFAQGFTPFRTKIGKFFTQFVLKYCSEIFVRDVKSQEILYEMGISSQLISDPVFGIPVLKPEKQEGIGVQLRSFHKLSDEFLDDLAKNIATSFPNEKIKLFSLQDVLDLPVLEKFAHILQENGVESVIYKNLTVEKATEELAKLEILIGMRFHACLVASKAMVRVLGINYDIKVSSLAKYVGFPFLEMNDGSIAKKIEKVKELDTSIYRLPEFNFPEF